MKITCISAANIEPARRHSASLHTCKLILDLVHEMNPGGMIDINLAMQTGS